MLDDFVCGEHPGSETYCTCSDIGGDERFIFEFQLHCLECRELIDSKVVDGGNPNSDAGNLASFCPYCGNGPYQHEKNPGSKED